MSGAAILGLAACGTPDAASSSAATGGSGSASTGAVRVAAASDLSWAMRDLQKEFDARGLRVEVTYGSSGTFYQQLGNGAPFDLYLSADTGYPDKLVGAGLADRADRFEYATGRLVLWVPTGSRVDPRRGVAGLTDTAVKRIALANPEHAPYGRAAMAAITGAGLAETLKSKLIVAENVSQAAEFVQSRNADVGLIALSLALSPPMRAAGRHAEIPPDSYPPLRQGGVVMGSAHGRGTLEAARAVRDVITGAQGQAVLARYGFAPPARG